MTNSQYFSCLTAGLTLAASIAGCGGGGGGGGGGAGGVTNPPVYSGNTNAAIITPTNASTLAARVLGSGDTATTSGGVSIQSVGATQSPSSGLVHSARRLNRSVREVAQQASAAPRVASGVLVDDIEPCDNGMGSARTSGTLSDVDFTGILDVFYNLCLIDGLTVHGPAKLRVDAFSFAFPQGIPSDSTLSYEKLEIRGPGVSVDERGSLRDFLDFGTNTEIVTINVVTRNNITGKTTKDENLVIVYVYNNIFSPTSFNASISGTLFDHDHGSVVVSTNAPLVFSTLTQPFPGGGQISLTGSGNARTRATALSPVLAKLELDLNNDSVFENAATLRWTDLDGPVGADLGDSDGDGMHNNWEIANGLNPDNSADALLDGDGDGFNNLTEYLAGADPNNSSSVPPTAGLAISMSALPDPVNVGGTLTYAITVANSSSSEAVGVVVTDTLPNGVSVGTVTTSQGSCTVTTITVTCSLGTVLGFNFASITINVTPNLAGALNNSVSVTSSTLDPDLTDNSTATSTMVWQTVTGTVVNLPGNSDLIYDATSQMIYAAVLGNPGAVIPVNPLTATLGTSISVGHDPVKLARSDDGQFLYVGLNGTNDVQRIALGTQTIGLTFTLGSGTHGQLFVEDMEVLPGNPQSVAISRKYKTVSPRHAGVAIFDHDVQRINTTQEHTGSNVIEFSASAGTLYGFNNETSEFGFRRLAVDASGVTEVDVHTGGLVNGPDIKFHAGSIYTNTGRVIDPDTRTIVGTFPLAPHAFGNLVAIDATVGRAFFLTGDSLPGSGLLRAFDLTTRQLVGSVIVQGMTGLPSSLIRWGAKGLAFRTTDGKIFLIESTILIP